MTSPPSPQSANAKKEESLVPLAIFYFLLGAGLMYLWYPSTYITLADIFGWLPSGSDSRERDGRMLMIEASFNLILLMFWIHALLMLLAGVSLARRVRYTFCIVVAGLACLAFPIGTILGVITLVHLTREGVRESFKPLAN